jgi:hypothetical protein
MVKIVIYFDTAIIPLNRVVFEAITMRRVQQKHNFANAIRNSFHFNDISVKKIKSKTI